MLKWVAQSVFHNFAAKELERIIRIADIDFSVDYVLRTAKTIATVRIKFPANQIVGAVAHCTQTIICDVSHVTY